jgi:putative glutamine amidotransferase
MVADQGVNMTEQSPVLGIICNLRRHETGIGHTVNTAYINAIEAYTSCRPLLIPCLNDTQDVASLEPILRLVDGILLTGSRTNIHPRHYGDEADERHAPLDVVRDRTSLHLAAWAIETSTPILGICRGLQELNVACGGTLCPDLQSKPNFFDHRMPDTDDFDFNHSDRHDITIRPEGLLASILGAAPKRVNSLHRQGIEKLGHGLLIEAETEDGCIEAISVVDHPFALGVQWHPEHQTGVNEVSAPLFAAFEQAMRARRKA